MAATTELDMKDAALALTVAGPVVLPDGLEPVAEMLEDPPAVATGPEVVTGAVYPPETVALLLPEPPEPPEDPVVAVEKDDIALDEPDLEVEVADALLEVEEETFLQERS